MLLGILALGFFATFALGQDNQKPSNSKCEKSAWVYRKNAEEHYRIASEDRTIDFWGKTFTSSLGLLAVELYKICSEIEGRGMGLQPR